MEKPEERGKKTIADQLDKKGIGAAEKAGLASEEGGWTPAMGGRRSKDDDTDYKDRIPTPRDVQHSLEERETDDEGGPDA